MTPTAASVGFFICYPLNRDLRIGGDPRCTVNVLNKIDLRSIMFFTSSDHISNCAKFQFTHSHIPKLALEKGSR